MKIITNYTFQSFIYCHNLSQKFFSSVNFIIAIYGIFLIKNPILRFGILASTLYLSIGKYYKHEALYKTQRPKGSKKAIKKFEPAWLVFYNDLNSIKTDLIRFGDTIMFLRPWKFHNFLNPAVFMTFRNYTKFKDHSRSTILWSLNE